MPYSATGMVSSPLYSTPSFGANIPAKHPSNFAISRSISARFWWLFIVNCEATLKYSAYKSTGPQGFDVGTGPIGAGLEI